MKQISCLRVPNLTGSIITTSYKSGYSHRYLSPFLLNEQLVKGRTCALSVLNNVKFWFFFSSNFKINSAYKQTHTFNEGLQLRLFWFGDNGLLSGDLLNKLINIGPAWWESYYEERLSRSIDFVSTSPLLRTYSNRIPGG